MYKLFQILAQEWGLLCFWTDILTNSIKTAELTLCQALMDPGRETFWDALVQSLPLWGILFASVSNHKFAENCIRTYWKSPKFCLYKKRVVHYCSVTALKRSWKSFCWQQKAFASSSYCHHLCSSKRGIISSKLRLYAF